MRFDPRERLLLNIAAYHSMLRHPCPDPVATRAKMMSLWNEYDATYGEAKTEKDIEFRRMYGHP